jgi:hypothetical protein
MGGQQPNSSTFSVVAASSPLRFSQATTASRQVVGADLVAMTEEARVCVMGVGDVGVR